MRHLQLLRHLLWRHLSLLGQQVEDGLFGLAVLAFGDVAGAVPGARLFAEGQGQGGLDLVAVPAQHQQGVCRSRQPGAAGEVV